MSEYDTTTISKFFRRIEHYNQSLDKLFNLLYNQVVEDVIPIKEWYATHEDWLCAPIIYITEDGVKELPLGEFDKFLKSHPQKWR